MENALRRHISISFERNPAKFKSLSERLEGILSSHHEDWQEIAKRLRILIDEARAASSSPGAPQGMEPNTEAPIFGVLRMRAGTSEKDVELAELACEFVRRLRTEAAISGFWDNTVALEERAPLDIQAVSTTAISFPSLIWTRFRPIAWALRRQIVGHSGHERDHPRRRSFVPGKAERST